MRELKPVERDLAGAGQAEEFRTINRDELPCFDGPPAGLLHERVHSHAALDDQDLIPLHWLPPRDEVPQVF